MKIVSLIGKAGCGKGTQIEEIVEKTGWQPISTGKFLRERAEKDDFIGNKLDQALTKGKLIPTPIVFNIWMPRLIQFRTDNVTEGVIFDGNPRKLYEAKMLEEVFDFFEWSDEFLPIYIDISDAEAKRRLLQRGRTDDNKEEIERRLGWFKTEVQPVLDYYQEKGILQIVNGEQSVADVQHDIFQILRI